MRSHLYVLSCLSFFVGCGSGDTPQTQEAIDCSVLSQTLDASAWAQAKSPARAYRYTAGLADNEINVEVLDDAGTTLGTLAVSQSLSGDDVGTMVIKLMRDGQAALTMSTQGKVGLDGFSVRSTLDNGTTNVEVLSRFENTSCGSALEDRPTCGGELPMDQPEFTMGSCGLAWETARAYGRHPRLTSVRYLTQTATGMGGVISSATPTYFVDVMDQGELTESADVQAWLQESGADAIIGTADELLLTTVYNDFTWKDAFLERAQTCEGSTRVATQALCAAPLETRPQAIAACGTAARRDEGAWGQSDKSAGDGACTSGCLRGDPHFISLDGHGFDFQGVGEYVLAQATQGAPFVVQARFAAVEKGSLAVCRNVSENSAVAFEWAGKRVAIYSDRDQALWIDGVPTPARSFDGPAGFTTEISDSTFVFRWPGGESVTFTLGLYPAITVDLPTSRYGQVEGLLGTLNANPSDEFTPRDSAALQSPVSSTQLYKVFGDSWRVAQFESLFDYEAGESAATFADLNFPATELEGTEIPEAPRQKAVAACTKKGILDPWLFQACVLDTVCSNSETTMSDVASPAVVTEFGDISFSVDGMVRPGAQTLDVAQTTACAQDLVAAVWVQQEATNLSLTAPVEVQNQTGKATLATGQTVYSFLVSFDPKTATSRLPATGSITFSSSILGLITSSTGLAGTDSTFGAERLATENDGLESDDVVTLSADGRRLDINFKNADNFDSVRVIVAAPQENP